MKHAWTAAFALCVWDAHLQYAEGSSMYVASLCKSGSCPDPMFPVLDFEPHIRNGTCLCRAHPCWTSRYHVKSCTDPEKPYLHVTYNKIRAFTCECREEPVYDSVHISRDKCPGQACPAEFPVLDFDADQDTCVCRAHPCDNIGGSKFECSDPDFPIRHYVEAANGSRPGCECRARLERPASSLRGRGADNAPNSTECRWNSTNLVI